MTESYKRTSVKQPLLFVKSNEVQAAKREDLAIMNGWDSETVAFILKKSEEDIAAGRVYKQSEVERQVEAFLNGNRMD